MAKLTLFILVAVLAFAVHAYKSYDGYVVIEAIPRNDNDREAVDNLLELELELELLHESTTAYHILVPPEKHGFATDFLTRHGLSVRVFNDRIQSDLRRKASFDYDDFNTYDQIAQEVHSLAARCPAGFTCTVESIAKTYEGRDLWMLKISKPGVNRKGVWIDASIHAQEWLATATHLKISKHLVEDYKTDADVKRFVDKYDFYLLPLANPDGYEFSRTTYRNWRKNRAPIPVPDRPKRCVGTDLNRNFNASWGTLGSLGFDNETCNEKYRGKSAASELEVQALQKAAVQYGPTLATSVHLHVYGQMWLIPYGSAVVSNNKSICDKPDDYDEILKVADKVTDAIQNTYGTKWARGTICELLYAGPGGAMDYFKETGGVKYTASPEVRYMEDQELFKIELSFREVWNGLRVLFDNVA